MMLTVKALSPDKTVMGKADGVNDPDVLANDIIENLESGIESFKEIMLTITGK